MPRDQQYEIPVVAPGGYFIEQEITYPLTQIDVDKLTSSGVMYLMAIYRDSRGIIRIEACLHTAPLNDGVRWGFRRSRTLNPG